MGIYTQKTEIAKKSLGLESDMVNDSQTGRNHVFRECEVKYVFLNLCISKFMEMGGKKYLFYELFITITHIVK